MNCLESKKPELSKAVFQVQRATDGFTVRVRTGRGSRHRFRVRATDAHGALRRATTLQDISRLLVASGHADLSVRFLTLAAQGDESQAEKILKKALELSNGRAVIRPAPRSFPTFSELSIRWTSGQLSREFPSHVRMKRSADDDVSRFKRINACVGNVAVRDFTLDHAQQAMRSLPIELTTATRRHYAQLISKLLSLAVYPCQLIERSPLPPGWLPRTPRDGKARPFLFPDEEAQLLDCTSVPLQRRVLYGLLTRVGLRLSEALDLTWDKLDLERGLITVDRNKTQDPRIWALGADVVGALRAYALLCPDRHPFGETDPTRIATRLRADLRTAGVTRAALYEKSESRHPIRLHDLRGTFVTLALATGKSETWVTDRTGHKSSVMLQRYRRQARSAAEVNLGWLHPMDECVPELREKVLRE